MEINKGASSSGRDGQSMADPAVLREEPVFAYGRVFSKQQQVRKSND